MRLAVSSGLDAWTAQSMATRVDEQAVSMVKHGPPGQTLLVDATDVDEPSMVDDGLYFG